ncbi:AfsR/SARP family transcriptional regulator [Pseudokineococcus sp. 5B2Z-1]|uniref:AfsR/SARP family transcriptional regulator n=1 Tax=Pseudokineococcus sp. 5B2Z-1 TaxID=3132744 RepID=UPI0030B7913C
MSALLRLGVLGPTTAWDAGGRELRLPGPRHRELLVRLAVARGAVVPVAVLVEDLWEAAAPDDERGRTAAVRTFVAALRRALEPDRTPRAPARVLRTQGPGYALHLPGRALDATAFEEDVAAARGLPPAGAQERLAAALATWRGPALADVAGRPWAAGEAARLEEVRRGAVEQLAAARVDAGAPGTAVPDLEAHVRAHPHREEGWRLLALALYRDGRQGDALAALRRARSVLADDLGVDPSPALARLERDVLHHAAGGPTPADGAAAWDRTATAYGLAVGRASRAHLRATGELLRVLATTGGPGLVAARRERSALVDAAEATGNALLLARLVGEHDVPALWTRPDDAGQAQRLVVLAERTLADLGPGAPPALRGRLLATVAVETRGAGGVVAARGAEAAREAEALARGLGDPGLLVHALTGAHLHTFDRAGLARRRAEVGAELVRVSARHDLVAHEVLGHLVLLQARCALGDVAGADAAAASADDLGARSEAPLVGVFTRWYRAVRASLVGGPADVVEALACEASSATPGDAMPGVVAGLLPMAVLAARVRGGDHDLAPGGWADLDPGPYGPWLRPWALLATGRRRDAARALARTPDPLPGHLLEAQWGLAGEAALVLGDARTAARACEALAPAAGEVAGAGSGMLAVGPVDDLLRRLDAAR